MTSKQRALHKFSVFLLEQNLQFGGHKAAGSSKEHLILLQLQNASQISRKEERDHLQRNWLIYSWIFG